jgi:hypothetical protein
MKTLTKFEKKIIVDHEFGVAGPSQCAEEREFSVSAAF